MVVLGKRTSFFELQLAVILAHDFSCYLRLGILVQVPVHLVPFPFKKCSIRLGSSAPGKLVNIMNSCSWTG